MNWTTRCADWFGVNSSWQRYTPRVDRNDWTLTLASLGLLWVSLELTRSYLIPSTDESPLWFRYVIIVLACVPLLVRRRAPIVAVLCQALIFWVVLSWVPTVAYQLPFQIVSFFVLYAAVAWARERGWMLLTTVALVVGLWVWVSIDFASGNSLGSLTRIYMDGDEKPRGPLNPLVAFVLYGFIVNTMYLCGAIALGVASWREARSRAVMADQAAMITLQASELREQAVTDERLRIARELHDVVAHHVSVMGIQAGAARRILATDPGAATEALSAVEASSREAVSQMRGLLGSLRGLDAPQASREPEPTLGELDGLVDSFRTPGFDVTLDRVEEPSGAAEKLALPVQVALSRTVEEALANVRKHSTAKSARVTLRVDLRPGAGFGEVEILDEGRPRGGTSGTGLGQLGMRERVNSLHGVIESGPRVTGGYRVRVRIPASSTVVTPGGLAW